MSEILRPPTLQLEEITDLKEKEKRCIFKTNLLGNRFKLECLI